MIAGSQIVKKTAVTALRGNYLVTVLSGLIFIFTVLVCALSSQFIAEAAGEIAADVIFLLLFAFICAPVLFGLIRFVWRILMGTVGSPVEVFYYFSSGAEYRRAMRLSLLLCIRAVVFGFIIMLPAILADVFSGTAVYDMLGIAIPMWASNLALISAILKTLGGLALFTYLLRYYLAPMLLAADESIEPDEAIHMSNLISKGSRPDFFLLVFSFLGWIILSVFMIPLPFTAPYFAASYLVHCRFAVAQYNRLAGGLNSSGTPAYAAGIR